jgi:hypothetical protein
VSPCLFFYSRSHVFVDNNVRLILMLLSCGKESGTLSNQMVSATFLQLINSNSTERDSTFLVSLYKYFSDSESLGDQKLSHHSFTKAS